MLLVAAPAIAGEPPTIEAGAGCFALDHTSMGLSASIQPVEGRSLATEVPLPTTKWSFKYSTVKTGPYTPVPGGSGTVTHAEFEADHISRYGSGHPINAQLTGLSPEVPYYVFLTLSNANGTTEEEARENQNGKLGCESVPLRPYPGVPEVFNRRASSAEAKTEVDPHGFETHWRYEFAPAEADGQAPAENSPSWAPAAGAEGTISQAEAAAEEKEGHTSTVEGKLTGLASSTSYFVRLFVESDPEFPAGSGKVTHKQAISSAAGFETEGIPKDVFTFAVHSLHGEAMHAFGSVRPNGAVTSEEQTVSIGGAPTGGTFSLAFKGQSTGATGTGRLASGAATGNGDISAASGHAQAVAGSSVLIKVTTATGAFAVGQTIDHFETPEVIPPGTTITAVGTGTLTLSANATKTSAGGGQGNDIRAALSTLTNVVTSTGAFAVGQHITAAGIPADTTIVAVGSGTLLLSQSPSEGGAAVPLSADTRIVSALHASTGAFTPGEAISGAGIPAGTTITTVESESLELSANTTSGGAAVALTAALPFDATGATVGGALHHLSSLEAPELSVRGPAGGPYVLSFLETLGGVDQPQLEGDASGLTPAGATVTVATRQQGGEGVDTRYHFEYVDQHSFETQGGFASAATRSTPEVDLGFGEEEVNGRSKLEFVGADLPGMQPGETYRYRIVATSTAPGNPVVPGEVQTLTVAAPAAASTAAPSACPNQAERTGPSAKLSECRAYEQITPPDKEGAQEIMSNGALTGGTVAVGVDGDHLMLDAQLTNWGSDPHSGLSPYFFTRTASGWQMTAATIQPEAGDNVSQGQIFSPDLTQFAFGLTYESGEHGGSPDMEFEAGPPGGPYTHVATIPRKQINNDQLDGWVASSADFSKLILKVEDHTLLGEEPTGTRSGDDLYELSAGALRQVNVTGPAPGSTIGACGARIARGVERYGGGAVSGSGDISSPNAVSADGRRVFFAAVPSGESCSAPSHLYMRLDGGGEGAETVDIGQYAFLAANPQGTELLLGAIRGESHEILRYDTLTRVASPLKGLLTGRAIGSLLVSEDLGTLYFQSSEALTPQAPPITGTGESDGYRYDIASETLSFTLPSFPSLVQLSRDGRYAYGEGSPRALLGESGPGADREQVFTFDAAQNLIQCMSCASSFDPEPKLRSSFGEFGVNGGREKTQNGLPKVTVASANGDYAFFDTPAALVPEDVNGEEPAPIETTEIVGPVSGIFSASSDVYEWRRAGVAGCTAVQGCLGLISSGRAGKLVAFLGSAEEGHDVFFTTASQLVPQDKDTALDIYDARIGGGFPAPPPGPVECEGDSCSTPFAAPSDATPSSSTFQGAGNVLAGALPEVKPKPKPKPKHKPKHKRRKTHTPKRKAKHARKAAGAHGRRSARS
jgi:hypothetical protein